MPRKPRLDLADVPQHIIQRGHDRQPCFFTEADYLCYLTELREISRREGCRVHAYVLMTNHVHLLATPAAAGQIGRMMQALGRRFVRYINDRHHRTGTLWEGRYKACLVDSDRYLLQCYRYIELNPVRAGMAAAAWDYRWSSFGCNALGRFDPLIQPHASFLALDPDPCTRQATYRDWVMQAVDTDETDAIRRDLQRQHAYGSNRFRAAVEAQLGRRAGPARMGRPRKHDLSTKSAT
ncbi:MAG TPA: transposase [Rhodanobacteraceae bacterium]|nr:transposase [Rhodanobacteraceae bacterium]